MGMFDEMRKREEAVKKGYITMNFEMTQEGISINTSLDINKRMLIEGAIIMLDLLHKHHISYEEVAIAKLEAQLAKKADNE